MQGQVWVLNLAVVTKGEQSRSPGLLGKKRWMCSARRQWMRNGRCLQTVNAGAAAGAGALAGVPVHPATLLLLQAGCQPPQDA